jgi:multidrug efflux pump subunit AcrA (membrane-fusion protein)
METERNNNSRNTTSVTRREKTLLLFISLFVILLSVGIARYLVTNRPQARRGRPPAAAPAVSVIRLMADDHQVMIQSMGTVEPDLHVSLVAETGGEIIDVHPSFVPGGIIEKDEILLRIDPTVYQTAVSQAELSLEQARLELRQEEGRQVVAEKEWALIEPSNATELEKDLALRKPHLRRARAQVRAAEATLRKARNDLAKTRVRAPFKTVIRSVDVSRGDVAAPQKRLAVLVGADAFRIIATLPVDRLPWLIFPSDNPVDTDAGRVLIHTTHGHVREGVLMNLLSHIEPGGRLAQVLIRVPDPLDLNVHLTDRLPLLLDQFVRLDVVGKTERNVYRISREYLRENDVIHLLDDDNTLEIRPVDVVWRDRDVVFLRGDLENKRLIVTDLLAPVSGMSLTLQQELSPDTEESPDFASTRVKPSLKGDV